MPDGLPDRFFDTVTLSDVVRSGAFALLAAGRIRGYSELKVVRQALAAGSILPDQPMTMPENELFIELLRTLGSGKTSYFAPTRYSNGIVPTDGRAARSSCAERGIPLTGTIRILKALCIDRIITSEEADAILNRIAGAGFHSAFAA